MPLQSHPPDDRAARFRHPRTAVTFLIATTEPSRGRDPSRVGSNLRLHGGGCAQRAIPADEVETARTVANPLIARRKTWELPLGSTPAPDQGNPTLCQFSLDDARTLPTQASCRLYEANLVRVATL